MAPIQQNIITLMVLLVGLHTRMAAYQMLSRCAATLTVLSEECRYPLSDVKFFFASTYDVISAVYSTPGSYFLNVPCSGSFDVIIQKYGFVPKVKTINPKEQLQVFLECPGSKRCIARQTSLSLRSDCDAALLKVSVAISDVAGLITSYENRHFMFNSCRWPFSVTATRSDGAKTTRSFSGSVNLLSLPCFTDRCGETISIQSGSYIPDQSTRVGSVIVYTCNHGFKFSGHNFAICLANKTWTEPPKCVADNLILCGQQPTVSNGYIVDTQGTFILYGCYQGYERLGIALVKCRVENLWSTPPTCYKFPCHVPDEKYAVIVIKDLTVTITCFPNYHDNDVHNLTCDPLTGSLVGDVPVCQKKFSSCPDYFISYLDFCFQLGSSTIGLSYNVAWGKCTESGSVLAAIETPELAEFFRQYMADAADGEYLIGLRYNQVMGEWVWSQSFLSDQRVAMYRNWSAGQPDGAGEEKCVYMDTKALWHDTSCTSFTKYICQRRSTDDI